MQMPCLGSGSLHPRAAKGSCELFALCLGHLALLLEVGLVTDDNHWWWVPCIAPLAGGVLGSTVYQACVGWHWDDDRQNPGAAEESAHKEEDPSQLDTYLLQPSANMV